MSQVVGIHNGTDQVRNNLVRSPLLTIPAAAYPDGRIMKPANASYAQQTVQTLDDYGNGASHVRIANGGYRTVCRVINVPLADNALHITRLVNNVGSGNITFGRIDGYGSPAGYLRVYDDRGLTDRLIMSPGMSMGIDSNMHRIAVQGSGCDANSYAIISYAMEIYLANFIFDAMPAVSTLLSFGDYAVFEVYANGIPGTVRPNNIGVEIPLSGLVTDFCDNLVTAFNTTYIAAVEPAGSQTPFHWAKKIAAEDLVYYKDSVSDSWLIATNKGVQFCSIDAAMIRNAISSEKSLKVQLVKQL